MTMRVEIEDLRLAQGGGVALDGVCLDVLEGELLLLAGASGSGKSSLLRCMAGWTNPDSGSVRRVASPGAHSEGTLAVALVSQNYALWPHMSVEQNVGLPLRDAGIPRDAVPGRVASALEWVGLAGAGARRPAQLSAGEQQRAALARALAQRPGLLLLDDALSTLGPSMRGAMRDLVVRLAREWGSTVVWACGDPADACGVADRVAVFDRGRVVQCGTPAAVFRRPVSREAALALGDCAFVPGTVERAQGASALCRTPLGLLEGFCAEEDLPEGSPVELLLRPGSVRMEAFGDENVFPAEIVSTLYQGATALHRARSGGCEFRILELNPRVARRDAGEEVSCWVDPDDLVVLPLR